MKKKLSLFVALIMMLSLFAGCGGKEATQSNEPAPSQSASQPAESSEPVQEGEKILTVGLTSDITPLSCVDPTTETAAWINNIMYPTLVSAVQNAEGKLETQWQLATEVTTEDNIHFQIHLRDDVYWSDGEKVTAEDVVFAIDTFTNPTVGSTSMATFLSMVLDGTDSRKGYREEGTELTSAYVLDEYTLEIVGKSELNLDFVVNRLCYNLYALPSHILSDIPAADLLGSDKVYEQKVVYGAFSVDSYITASELVLAANENYYKGAPTLDYIRFVFLTSAQVTSQLASGEIDMAWPGTIDAADYAYVTGLENVVTSVGAPNSLVAMFVNNEKIPDANVRKAISLAIDRSMIVQNVLGGYAEIAGAPVSSTSAYYSEDFAPTYDVEAAKALLAQSDFDLSQTLYLSIGAGKQTAKNNALLIEAMLESVGFNIEIKEVENAVLDCIMGNYDITFITQTEQPLTPSHTLGIAVYNNSWCKYSNPTADALYDSLVAPATAEELQDAMYQLQKIVVEDCPIIPLYNATSLLAKNKCMTVGGPASYGMLANINEWDVQR